MPRSPILTAVDWPTAFAAGHRYEDWLDLAESEDQRGALNAGLAQQILEPQEEALLANLPRKVHVLAFAEGWCDDVVRHVPVLQAMADVSECLLVRYVSREEQPDIFARYLTNGGEAVPKFVFLNDAFVECGNWGPMPENCCAIIARGKACGDIPAARRLVAARYAADPERRTVVRELMRQVQTAAAATP